MWWKKGKRQTTESEALKAQAAAIEELKKQIERQELLLEAGAGAMLDIKEKMEEQKEALEEQIERRVSQETHRFSSSAFSIVDTDMELFEIRIGAALVPLDQESKLKSLVSGAREEIRKRTGVIPPQIHIMDDASMPLAGFQISVKEKTVFTAEMVYLHSLAVKTPLALRPIEGKKAVAEWFGKDSVWIAPEKEEEAREAGYEVLSPEEVLWRHAERIMRERLHEFVDLRTIEALINEHAGLWFTQAQFERLGLFPSSILEIVRNLVRKGVSVRDFQAILSDIYFFGRETSLTSGREEAIASRIRSKALKELV